MNHDEPVRIPINGTLDLHHFKPSEVADLVVQYIYECMDKEIHSIRLIHGKGTGTLRETVHSTLRKIPEVSTFRLADETGGGWGSTLVELR